MATEQLFGAGGVVVTRVGRKRARRFTPRLGQTYRIEPHNVQKKRHRGRVCELVADKNGRVICYADDKGFRMTVAVRFLDNGRRGRADPGDLVEVATARARTT